MKLEAIISNYNSIVQKNEQLNKILKENQIKDEKFVEIQYDEKIQNLVSEIVDNTDATTALESMIGTEEKRISEHVVELERIARLSGIEIPNIKEQQEGTSQKVSTLEAEIDKYL